MKAHRAQEPIFGGPNTMKRLAEIATEHDLQVSDLRGPSHVPQVSHARQHAYADLRANTKLSFPQIGAILGGRDHSTVIKGARAHAKRMAEDRG